MVRWYLFDKTPLYYYYQKAYVGKVQIIQQTKRNKKNDWSFQNVPSMYQQKISNFFSAIWSFDKRWFRCNQNKLKKTLCKQ